MDQTNVYMEHQIKEINAAEVDVPRPDEATEREIGLTESHVPPATDKTQSDLLLTIDAVKSFYHLDSTQVKSRSSKYGFEEFLSESFDQYSLSNSFKTSGNNLPYWILGLQNHVYVALDKEGKFNVEWKNKTDAKQRFIEIEIKIKHVKKKDVLLTIHVYLTTGLVHCKGKLLHDFVDNIFPEIKQSVQVERENGGSGENIPGPKAATHNLDSSTENKNNQACSNLHQNAALQLSKINFLDFFDDIQRVQSEILKGYRNLQARQTHLEKSVASQLLDTKTEIVTLLGKATQKDTLDHSLDTLDHSKYEETINALREENGILVAENDDKTRSITNLKGQIKDLTIQLKDRDNSLKEIRGNKEAQKVNIDEITNLAREKDKEIWNLKEQIKSEKGLANDLKQKVVDVDVELHKIHLEARTLAQRNADLQDLVVNLKEQQTLLQSIVRNPNVNDQPKDQSRVQNKERSTKDDEILLLGDSHFKRIQPDLLFKKENIKVEFKFAPRLGDVERYIEQCQEKYTCIVIHCGTNDLKFLSAEQITSHLADLAVKAKRVSPVVFIGNIIPRYDDKELAIKAQIVNTSLAQKEMSVDDVQLCLHNNLNTREEQVSKFYEEDGIHLKTEGTKIFASNLKFYICKGLGIQAASRDRSRSQSPQWGRQNRRQKHYRRYYKR